MNEALPAESWQDMLWRKYEALQEELDKLGEFLMSEEFDKLSNHEKMLFFFQKDIKLLSANLLLYRIELGE